MGGFLSRISSLSEWTADWAPAEDILWLVSYFESVVGYLPRDSSVRFTTPSFVGKVATCHFSVLPPPRGSRWHKVLTAICCMAPKEDAAYPGYELATHIEETKVYFASEEDGLPDDVIESYVRTREGVDKAGGYAVQGLAGMMLVAKVEGCVDNVVGLPVRKTLQLCEKVVFRQGEVSEGDDDD